MARKSIKGYAEKNYYDNTKFTGGIVATNDPLNEGSFKHLVNFDISDMGQSLTPRKGFLTTTLKAKLPLNDEYKNISIAFNVKNINNSVLTDLTNTTWEFTSWSETNSAKGFYQINMIVDDIEYTELGIGYMSNGPGNYESDYGSLYFNGDNGNTSYTYSGLSSITITGGTDVTNTKLISWLQANATQVVSTPTYRAEISGVTDHPEWNYLIEYMDMYEVTDTIYITFGIGSGSVPTPYTVDFTQEGVHFKMVYPYPGPYEFTVPWDGSSVTVDLTKPSYDMSIPRIDIYSKEDIHHDENSTAVLDYNTLYFYDINLNQYIFLDLAASSILSHHAWRVNLNIQGTYITECEHIKYIDTSDLLNIIPTNTFIFSNLHVINNPQAIHIIDEYMINSYIIKVAYTYIIDDIEYEKQFWLKMYYRKDPTGTLTGDTLVLTYLDTDNIVNYVDPTKRNLASTQDIIPSNFQNIYYGGSKPIGFVQEFPMIYIKDPTGKYLVNTTKQIEGLTLIPHYNLEDLGENYNWCYTYDISTMYDSGISNIADNVIYKSPVFNLLTNTVVNIDEISYKSLVDILTKYEEANTEAFDKFIDTHDDYLFSISNISYRSIVEQSVPTVSNKNTSYIIYLVPKPTKGILTIPCTTVTNVDEKIINIGPGGLSTYFSGDGMVFELFNEDKTDSTIIDYERFTSLVESIDPDDSGLPITLDEFKQIPTTIASVITNDTFITSTTYRTKTDINTSVVIDNLNNSDVEDILQTLKDLESHYDFYVYEYTDLKNYSTSTNGFDSTIQTAFDSPIITFEANFTDIEYTNPHKKTSEEIFDIIENFKLINDIQIFFNVLEHTTRVRVSTYTTTKDYKDQPNYITYEDVDYLRLFPGSITDDAAYKDYLVCTNLTHKPSYAYIYIDTIKSGNEPKYKIYNYYGCTFTEDKRTGTHYYNFNKYFKPCAYNNTMRQTLLPTLGTTDSSICRVIIKSPDAVKSLFELNDNILQASLSVYNNPIYSTLNTLHYFDKGLNITFYLLQVPTQKYIDEYKEYVPDFKYTREYLLNTTSLYNSRQIILSKEEPATYTRVLVDDPNNIKDATEYLAYNSLLGGHVVVYKDNILYISKENIPYYFPEENKKVFPEPIVKALQYKDLLLVFTVQNLYAVYLYETTVNVENGTDDEGNTKYVQQKVYNFASLPVLYNIMVNEKYKDAIQVYNQMILFYSADGQMFLIKPTAAIDSNTRFSIQYFNKSANDILLNYKQYIQERLIIYGINPDIKEEDITIKVVANINYIKIFYNVPGKITYILVYDVLNNRYYSYDTVSFSNVRNIHYTPDGEMYITEHDNKLYFTTTNVPKQFIDSNVDSAYYNNFSPMQVQCELDTGTINLNNHLKKRFKDLRVIYKNLDANELEFKLETFVDDIPTITYIDTALEIKDVSGYNTLTVTKINKVIQLFENNALFNFADYNSNKIITHRTNIVNRGKAIRFKMNFSSKGKYKIQGYGLIYKEHTV